MYINYKFEVSLCVFRELLFHYDLNVTGSQGILCTYVSMIRISTYTEAKAIIFFIPIRLIIVVVDFILEVFIKQTST